MNWYFEIIEYNTMSKNSYPTKFIVGPGEGQGYGDPLQGKVRTVFVQINLPGNLGYDLARETINNHQYRLELERKRKINKQYLREY